MDTLGFRLAVALLALSGPAWAGFSGEAKPLDAAAARAEKAPTLPRVRVKTAGKELAAWQLDVEEEGKQALLGDDGAVVWIAAQPEPNWLERTELPLAQVPPPQLAALLADASVVVRERTEELLIAQGPVASDAVAAMVRAESADARKAALSILSEKPSRKWRARIKERLKDEVVAVRRAAMAAYSALKPDDLRTTCLDVLRFDESPLLHHDAIGTLGFLGDPRSIDVVLEHLEGCEERSERLIAFDALRRITGLKFGRDADAWRAWWTNHRDEVLAAAEAAADAKERGEVEEADDGAEGAAGEGASEDAAEAERAAG